MRDEKMLAELERARHGVATAILDLAKHCDGHPRQLAFTQARSKFFTACCSRRAGKSEGCGGKLWDAVLGRPNCVALYITKTRINAKRIIWGVLKRINREHRLGGKASESELSMTAPNGSVIYLVGANNRDEIEKFRGLPIVLVLIDESQMLLAYLEELVNDVLGPALMDFDGAIGLVGTPAPVPSGFFYDCVSSPEWEHYTWTAFDNPWILKKSGKTPREHLNAELKRRGVKEDDPSIQREWFGKWAYDPNALVFRYSADINHYDELPNLTRGEWHYGIAGDIGHDDADALAVLAWHSTLPNLWLVEESVLTKQTVTQLGNRTKALYDKYNPLFLVFDTGALGKKIAAELTARWSLPVEAAEKDRKLEHIELLNDTLRSGNFKAKKESHFAQDCMLVEWDRDNPEKPKISERYHSDVCDAVLYGERRAQAYLAEQLPPIPPPSGSPEWLQLQAKRLQEEEQRIHEEQQREADERQRERLEAEEVWEWT